MMFQGISSSPWISPSTLIVLSTWECFSKSILTLQSIRYSIEHRQPDTAHLPEPESVGIKTIEVIRLHLDCVLQVTNRIPACNLHMENALRILAKNPTIESEHAGCHDECQLCVWVVSPGGWKKFSLRE